MSKMTDFLRRATDRKKGLAFFHLSFLTALKDLRQDSLSRTSD